MLTRKDFLMNTLRFTAAGTLLQFPFRSIATPLRSWTVQQVIDLVLKDVPGAPFKETVDVLKTGKPDSVVTGIVTTMFPTMAVIRKTIALNANFIIAHEPTFYNHADAHDWVPSNAVMQEKEALLNKHGITVWRFHDYAHSLQPDIVGYGVLKKAGWERYNPKGELYFKIPTSTLKATCAHLKKTLGIHKLKVIGDPAEVCSSVVLIPGAAGGQMHVTNVEQYNPDLLIVGEIQEWETGEYIRDRQAQGKKTALIVLGHSVSEEPGMELLAERLKKQLTPLPVTHVASGDPFVWEM